MLVNQFLEFLIVFLRCFFLLNGLLRKKIFYLYFLVTIMVAEIWVYRQRVLY